MQAPKNMVIGYFCMLLLISLEVGKADEMCANSAGSKSEDAEESSALQMKVVRDKNALSQISGRIDDEKRNGASMKEWSGASTEAGPTSSDDAAVNSDDCITEYENAVANNQMSSFCNRCKTEGGANALRNRCSFCQSQCNSQGDDNQNHDDERACTTDDECPGDNPHCIAGFCRACQANCHRQQCDDVPTFCGGCDMCKGSCAGNVQVSGSKYHPHLDGLYAMTAITPGTQNDGRPIYHQWTKGNYLYYLKETEAWHIGPDFGEGLSLGHDAAKLISHVWGRTKCPTRATGWKELHDKYGWTSNANLVVREQTCDDITGEGEVPCTAAYGCAWVDGQCDVAGA